jgi:AraC-like DNA-binding protein
MGEVWCVHWHGYPGAVTVNGHRIAFLPGDIVVLPPYANLDYECPTEAKGHVAIQFEGNLNPDAVWRLPALIPAQAAQPLIARLRPCIEDFYHDQMRIEVRLWDVLLNMAVAAGAVSEQPNDDLVRRAQMIADERLAVGIDVTGLAAAVHLSQSQLNRRFRAATGLSVGLWLTRRRATQALHLLQETRLPIREIAAAVGRPDLQHFNRVRPPAIRMRPSRPATGDRAQPMPT